MQENGPLVSLLQTLQATLEDNKMAVVICPRAALVSEKYVRTRMRMWGAIAKYQVQHQCISVVPVLNVLHTVKLMHLTHWQL